MAEDNKGFLNSVASAVPVIGDFLGGLIGSRQQYKQQKDLAAFQHSKNMELLKYQLDYNSPSSQMARYKDAGLNPNLIYGQGSSGNMQSAPSYPDLQPQDMSFLSGIGTQIQQLKLMEAQTDLTRTKVDESTVKQSLNRAQESLLKANPYMRKEYVDQMVNLMGYSAQVKESEAILGNFQTKFGNEGGVYGLQRIQKELDLLDQKFQLNQADKEVKAQIIQSKEFQNALDQIQVEWMKDGQITSQHIYQFVMMLLSRLAR